MAKRNRKATDAEEILIEGAEGTQETVNDSTAWFEANKNLIMGVIGALILLTAVFIVYKYMIKEPKEKAAKAAIFKAEQQFEQDSFNLALTNPGAGYEGLLDIIDNYGGTKTANLAKLYAGISYLNLGRFDDAVSYLSSHSASGTYSPIIKNGNLGDAYSEKGDFGNALSSYQKATTASEDALLTPYYLYKLGLLAKKQGDNSKALSAFNKIKNKYPNSNEAQTIGVLITSLEKS